MKKCPNCQKTFDDDKRFCQIDGTPLIDDVPAEDENPFKTVVVGKQDIPPGLISDDAMKTTVMRADSKEDDILQIPEVEEFDPMKTMVVSEPIKYEKPTAPPPVDEPVVPAPEPPKFNEPNLSPPNFGDLSANQPPKTEEPKFETPTFDPPKFDPPKVEAPINNPFNEAPKFDKPIANPFSTPVDSPFSPPPKAEPPKFDSAPLPSDNLPFEMPKNEPPSPFGMNEPPPSPFKEPETNIPPSPFTPTPFEPNLPVNQPIQPTEWNPPPVPAQNQDWQNQSMTSDSQFQPSAPVGGKQNTTLGLVSLILGITSFLCGLGFLAAIPAIILGYMQKGKIKSDPVQFGGSGLATGGIILGVINLIITVLAIVVWILLVAGMIRF